ncbi:lachesin-like [Wyeomyia smithii]|uniref:lachesin-like n=1 Tax=Wyeomyia smithii TaxID=174621 RepID=UPI0024680FF2|nr:lachesin-like [Wyeomyia smithii]XP_055545210.1 lachesin-like [Wyeomyia smithii]XP_055545211.1 lachesin-like [Wyeomyia smithii]XP_055545212.1 lachesin-like [Wyeomyia smithii]XP_055545213.1 lachesin-like [Wyeomyia smithii]XP_055545214.1 lachesin-like [Wyeomyia smithii]XP_055545215.1 lachesin-like [Wyeomyia smithii]XP_055545216.1 lachesin-like [Wyeomyia smithii]XP_055545217.1 lachesin-like [Wyeomyia smithii]XP_055545218.1 lachesin-like [Wyeomyia smithii]XP_055545219.1 lachesin-like [Wyeom
MSPVTERHTVGALLLMLLATTTRVSTNTAVKTGTVPAVNVIIEEPEFTDVIENVTVPAGRNVKLACSVKNLGSYKVAWMHFEQSAILTVHNHVITRNPRISVTHDKHDKHKTWFLHISNVQEEDKGRYMCQINTVTAKTQFGYLHVVVPPNIDDSLSSSDVIVREGSNVTLKCRATGSPHPLVKWKRDDNSKITINKSLSVLEWDGESVEISKISRLDMGAYLCIASNGVPPTVSKRIKVSVDFPPMLWIPHQLVGVPLYFNVTLECFTEAHPTSLNYWTREDGHMIHDSRKYRTESMVGAPVYKTHMRLNIFNIQQNDYGTYKCVAKNPRGETDGTIRLYISTPPTTSPSPTTTELQPLDYWPGNGRNDSSGWHHNINGLGTGQHHPNSYSVHVTDKNSKYSSNLNDIDKSEQKSLDSKVIYWSSANGSSRVPTQTIHIFLSSIIGPLLLGVALVKYSIH